MSRLLLVGAAMLAACAAPPLLEQGLRPLRAVQSPFGTLSARTCAECHADTHAGWAGSRHAQSYTNALFQVSLKDAVQPGWCLDCHAPLPDQREDAALRDEGITCVACHARKGVLLSATPPSEKAQAQHPIRHEPTLGTSEFCSGCHQFGLRDDHPMASDVPVQTTYDEWRASGSDQPCQDCHVDGHRFPGGHDTDLVRGAIHHRVSVSEETIALTLTTDVPHAVPTGDPFRRLVWEVCADPACTEVLTTRLAAKIHAGPQWHLRRDTTLAADRPIHWTAPRPPGTGHWKLWLAFGEPRLEPLLAPEDVRMLIAEGSTGSDEGAGP